MPTKYVVQRFIGHWEDILTSFNKDRAFSNLVSFIAEGGGQYRMVSREDKVMFESLTLQSPSLGTSHTASLTT